jgi:hypothetical protein
MLITGMSGIAAADEPKPPAKPSEPRPAEPKPAPPPKEAAAPSAEVKAGTGVEKHEVVGETSTFPVGTTVWVWSRISNGQGSIKHVWKQEGKEVWSITLPVGSARWSTMSRRTMHTKGSWDVDVQTEAGASIGSVTFKVE